MMSNTDQQKIWAILQEVNDPEIPVLSVIDLGIVRNVIIQPGKVEVVITPTYSGCPAMNRIEWDIRSLLIQHGYKDHKITTILSPAWTTDWITEGGRQKLKAFGIAPPNPTQSVCDTGHFGKEEAVPCPQCGSYHTAMISRFGSTACKALYRCNDCQEPFDYFKCH